MTNEMKAEEGREEVEAALAAERAAWPAEEAEAAREEAEGWERLLRRLRRRGD